LTGVVGAICASREVASAAGEEERLVEVVYQRLQPGIDVRKGIPQDVHKGWKKYGNKSIQNANFCRYKQTSLFHQFRRNLILAAP
jgi:hypothetical protein